MGLLDILTTEGKKYIKDALPGGRLNPEVTPQGLLDTAALATMPVPILGDAVGLGADAYRLAKNPEERTPLNYGMAALGALPFVPAGMFIGKGAKTWDALAASKATKMEKAGTDPRAIWKETGTFKGPDGQWRQEIDDSTSAFIEKGFSKLPGGSLASKGSRIDKVLKHDELFAAYPGAKKIDPLISINPMESSFGSTGKWREADGILEARGATPSSTRSATLHELQHAIQGVENWGRGGPSGVQMWMGSYRPDAVAEYERLKSEILKPMPVEDYARNAWQSDVVLPEIVADYKKNYLPSVPTTLSRQMDIDLQTTAGWNAYKRLAGEAESRATEARMNLNAQQRRDLFPLDSYDVPIDQLIIRK